MAPNNPLPCHGNEKTMNLNSLILTNIQSSPYFKVNLYELKTYHEVIDEIYYKVDHLEPWEKGSRKTAGQTGMCGGVRGVGAGGIVSSSFCLLYKLFTLKLTRKQVLGLCTHTDSPYIRALGFMYIRYTQHPGDMWEWYKDFMEDDEEIDVKAGGGHNMIIGEMLRQWMTKLEWYGTLFPRIPVPIQKQLENHLRAYDADHGIVHKPVEQVQEPVEEQDNNKWGEAERVTKLRDSPPGRDSREGRGGSHRASPPFDIAKEIDKEKDRHRKRSRSRERDRHRQSHRSPDRDRKRGHDRKRSKSRDRKRSRSRERRRSREKRSRSRDRRRRSNSRDRSEKKRRSRSREKHKHKHSSKHRESSFDRDLRKERSRIKGQNGE